MHLLRKSAVVISMMTTTLLVAALSHTTNADAQDRPIDKKTCIAAAERGQELRDGKHMRDARGQFALCARSECPKTVVAECTRWRSEADAALGSVKLEAVDQKNNPVTTVKIVIDGSPWTDDLSAPIVLDPGSHEIRFEREGSPVVVRTVTLAMGERDQVVRAVIDTAAPLAKGEPAHNNNNNSNNGGNAKDEKPSGSLVTPIVLGSVGVVSLGFAGAFWLMGNADLDDARARCTAGCPDSEADRARTKHLIGDIGLGVGIIALAAAAYFLITREPPTAAVSARARGRGERVRF